MGEADCRGEGEVYVSFEAVFEVEEEGNFEEVWRGGCGQACNDSPSTSQETDQT